MNQQTQPKIVYKRKKARKKKPLKYSETFKYPLEPMLFYRDSFFDKKLRSTDQQFMTFEEILRKKHIHEKSMM